MKKLLALVLAMVMTLGLATVSSSAAYSDAADVSLEEAVDVMSAVGVFQGSDGKFSPKANLNREQAAKLIAYLDLGESAAEALPAVKVFSDVPATSWSAKYIAYCADAGYIAGDGTGKFNPTGELNGYAFGKMLLCVLGYDADIEGFTGNTWSINVAKLMESNDIADGVSGAASATLTREQAAQYCLNALQATTVKYDTKGTSIEINGAKIATGASKAENVTDKGNRKFVAISGEANYNNNTEYTVELGEKLYGSDLKLTTPDDAFGAPATKWTYKNSSVGTYSDTPDATYTGKVTMGTIYDLLGKDVADDLKHKNNANPAAYDRAELKAYVDGAEAAAYAQETQVVKNSSAAAFGTGNGTVTEIYIDDDGSTIDAAGESYASVKVIVKNTYLMKANADYNAKTEKLSADLITKPAALNGNSVSLSADDFNVADFKDDDYILYTYAGGDYQTIEKANVVSGKVTTWTSGSNVTLDGTKYSYSTTVYDYVNNNDASATDGHDKQTQFTINETATLVLDNQGYILYVDDTKESNDNVVFVTDATKNGFAVQAKIITTDGTKSTVSVDTDDSNGNFATSATKQNSWDPANVSNLFWAYEVDGSDYELTSYNKQTGVKVTNSALTLNKQTSVATNTGAQNAQDINYTANSKTVYIVADASNDIHVYTGVKNAPNFTNYVDTAKAVYNSDNEIVYLYVKVTNDSGIDDASSTDQMIYVLKIGGNTITDSNKKTYVEVKALVNGEEQTLNVKPSAIYSNANQSGTVVLNKLYKNMKTNSDGYVTSMTAVTDNDDYDAISITNQQNAFGYSDGVFTAKTNNGYSKFIGTDKVYLAVSGGALLDDPNADYELTETTFEGLKNFVKDYYVNATGWTLVNSDGEVTAAYITITNSGTSSLGN